MRAGQQLRLRHFPRREPQLLHTIRSCQTLFDGYGADTNSTVLARAAILGERSLQPTEAATEDLGRDGQPRVGKTNRVEGC